MDFSSNRKPRRIVIDSRMRNIDEDGGLFSDSTVRSWSNFEVAMPESIPNVTKIELFDHFFPYDPATISEPWVNIRLRPNGKLPTGVVTRTESALPLHTITTASYKSSLSQVYNDVLCTQRIQSTFFVGGVGAAVGCFEDSRKSQALHSLDFTQSGKLTLNSLRVEFFTINSTKPTATSLAFQQPVYLVGPTMTDATNPYESTRNCVLILLIHTSERG